MNKSCRNILALAVLALSPLLSAAPAGGQNLSPEQQKKELCENNRNYIADYKRQGQQLNRVATVIKKEEPFRNSYSKLNQAIANDRIVVGDGEEMRRIATDYDLEWDDRWYSDMMAFQKAWRDRMTELIEEAKQYNSVKEVEDKIGSINQQMKYHEDRLRLLGCDQSSGGEAEAAYPQLQGSWESDYKGNWNPTSVTQSGNKLSFTNEFGDTSPGEFVSKTRVKATKWEGGLGATVSEDGKTISWDNGTTWRRRQ